MCHKQRYHGCWWSAFFIFFLLLSVPFYCTSCTEKHTGWFYVSLRVHLLILYSVHWISSCHHADTILPALSAPHERLSGTAIEGITHFRVSTILTHNEFHFTLRCQQVQESSTDCKECPCKLQRKIAEHYKRLIGLIKSQYWLRCPDGTQTAVPYFLSWLCVCVCVCGKLITRVLMVWKSFPRPYTTVRRSSTTFEPLSLLLSEYMYGCWPYFSRNTSQHEYLVNSPGNSQFSFLKGGNSCTHSRTSIIRK